MKKCKNCQSLLPDEYKHCNTCGAVTPEFSTAGGVFLGILKGCLFVALFLGIQVAVAGIVSSVVSVTAALSGSLNTEDVLNSVYKYMDVISIVSAILFVCVLLIIFAVRKKNTAKEISLVKCSSFGLIAAAFVLGFALNFVSSIGTSFIPFSESVIKKYEETYSYLGMGNPVIEFIDIAIIAPIAEEIAFRGLCYGRMRKVMPMWLAALVSAVVFGIAHGNLISFTFTVVLGYIMAVLLEKTGSLYVTIAIHIGFNATSYLVDYLTDKYNSVWIYLSFFIISFVISAVILYAMLTVARHKKDESRIEMLIHEEYRDLNAPDESLFRRENPTDSTEHNSEGTDGYQSYYNGNYVPVNRENGDGKNVNEHDDSIFRSGGQ